MLNQIERQNNLFIEVFTERNIQRARKIYQAYVDKYLANLSMAMKNNDVTGMDMVKKKLEAIVANLSVLPESQTQSVSEKGEPVSFDKKMTSKSAYLVQMELCRSYVDIYLDMMNQAMKRDDLEGVENAKQMLKEIQEEMSKRSKAVVY